MTTTNVTFINGPIFLTELYKKETREHFYIFGELHEKFPDEELCPKDAISVVDYIFFLFKNSPQTKIHFYLEVDYQHSSLMRDTKYNMIRQFDRKFESCFKTCKKKSKENFPNKFFHFVDVRAWLNVHETCVSELADNKNFSEHDKKMMCLLLGFDRHLFLQNDYDPLDIDEDTKCAVEFEQFIETNQLDIKWSQFPSSSLARKAFFEMLKARIESGINTHVSYQESKNNLITSIDVQVTLELVSSSTTSSITFLFKNIYQELDKKILSQMENEFDDNDSKIQKCAVEVICNLADRFPDDNDNGNRRYSFYPQKIFLARYWESDEFDSKKIKVRFLWKKVKINTIEDIDGWRWSTENGREMMHPLSEWLQSHDPEVIQSNLFEILKINKQFTKGQKETKEKLWTAISKFILERSTLNDFEDLTNNLLLDEDALTKFCDRVNFIMNNLNRTCFGSNALENAAKKISNIILSTFVYLVDMYTIGRLLRTDFHENQEQDAILYLGADHSRFYIAFLQSYGFKIVQTTDLTSDIACIDISKFKQPFFT